MGRERALVVLSKGAEGEANPAALLPLPYSQGAERRGFGNQKKTPRSWIWLGGVRHAGREDQSSGKEFEVMLFGVADRGQGRKRCRGTNARGEREGGETGSKRIKTTPDSRQRPAWWLPLKWIPWTQQRTASGVVSAWCPCRGECAKRWPGRYRRASANRREATVRVV